MHKTVPMYSSFEITVKLQNKLKINGKSVQHILETLFAFKLQLSHRFLANVELKMTGIACNIKKLKLLLSLKSKLLSFLLKIVDGKKESYPYINPL